MGQLDDTRASETVLLMSWSLSQPGKARLRYKRVDFEKRLLVLVSMHTFLSALRI